jgi:tRNA (uracil-5-)-methyltransferase
MIIICHAPSSGGAGKSDDGSDDYSLEFEKERDRLVNMLTQGTISKPKRSYREEDNDSDSGCDIRVTSIFFQEFDGLSNPGPQHPVQHVYGNKFIEEKLLQCTFQISPGAFFQVTTEGAENLYKLVVEKVREVTNNPKDTLLFDVCCGTGTIGLTCMKEGVVGKVIGIDIAEPAIKDAVDNAIRNGYSNEDSLTKFVASRAEAVMHDEIKNAGDNMHMVAVVDPAREGLHQDVLRAIRNEKKIQRLVYVSCNPTGSLIKDCTVLCCPPSKKYFGMPFKPTFAQPVDMFPLTSHCEMVMVFDRLTDEELNGDRQYKKQNVKNVGTNGQSEEGSTEKIDIEDGGNNTENKNNDGTDN